LKHRWHHRRFDAETRAELGLRLRRMYRSLGWSRADAAKFLHVSERTLHNWESGRHDIPFAVYRLMRIEVGYCLPGSTWRGWSMAGGKLYTPEGIGLDPASASWWGLLVRRAETGAKALAELHRLKSGQRASAAPADGGHARSARGPLAAGGARAPLPGAAGGAAAPAAAGLVPSKTTLTRGQFFEIDNHPEATAERRIGRMRRSVW